MKVGANESVLVQENSSAVISQACLRISNPHIPPTDVVYTLTRPPRHGYLAIDPKHPNGEPSLQFRVIGIYFYYCQSRARAGYSIKWSPIANQIEFRNTAPLRAEK
jgi:hypothetical protein